MKTLEAVVAQLRKPVVRQGSEEPTRAIVFRKKGASPSRDEVEVSLDEVARLKNRGRGVRSVVGVVSGGDS